MFHSARLKLTTWYLLIIMLISICFSAVIYRFLTIEVDRFARKNRVMIERKINEGDFFSPPLRIRQSIPLEFVEPDLIEEIKLRILWILILVNGGIFIFSGGFGYLLAGKTLKPIKDMVEEQNRFISDASHELRTPLTSLKTAMEVYLRDKKHKLSNATTIIKESIEEVNKIQALSESLLTLAQYQKPNGNTKIENLNLSKILDESIKKIAPIAKNKLIKIQPRFNRSQNNNKNFQIKGNKFALVDLFVILLDNAVKYSKNGQSVVISSKHLNNSILISVEDYGIGIEKKDLPHIFDRFYRSDLARTKRTYGGYGLGLAIAKKIVEAHNGMISVTSKVGEGTKFIVKLPLFTH